MWRCADAHISSHSHTHTHTHLHSNMSWVHMHVYTIPCTHVYHTQPHTHYKYMHCWRWVGGKEKNETTHYYNHAFSADVLMSWKEKTVQVPASPEPSVIFTCLSIWLPAEQLYSINIHTHFKKEEKSGVLFQSFASTNWQIWLWHAFGSLREASVLYMYTSNHCRFFASVFRLSLDSMSACALSRDADIHSSSHP